MPIKLTMIPKPSAETTPRKSGRGETSKNTKKTSHRKSKHRRSNSPAPAHRRHQDIQNEVPDPFSITNYIQDQVHTAVRKIPGVQWFTDNVSHPIHVAREKLDKFEESLSPKRSHADGSWLYPKGREGREESRKPAEIDIDSLKRSHKKKVKKERRKMKKASLERNMSRTELREELEDSYRDALDDSLADLAEQGSEERLFTIEDVNVASGRSKKKYRPKKLVNLTSNLDDIQDASKFSSRLPTRNEFKFTPRLLKYESETQSGTLCTVDNPYDFCRSVIGQKSQQVREYYMPVPEERMKIFEDGEMEQNKEIKLSWYPETRTRSPYDSSFDGYKQKRKFKKDVHFIGIEPMEPFSSSEEAITDRHRPKRKLVRDNKNESNHCGATTVVRPLHEEQVFETGQPIRNFTSQLKQEESTHNGLNDFSDENFLSMPKFVKVLPSSDESNCLFPMSLAEHQSSARKYPKPRMFDEFEGLFVGQQEDMGASNDVHDNECRPGEFQTTYVDCSVFKRKYPKSRMEDEYEGLFVGQEEEVDAINDKHEIDCLSEEFLPSYVPAVSSNNGFSSMFSRKYPKPRMEGEFEGLFVGQEDEVDNINDVHEVESNQEELMHRYVQVLPSSDSSMLSNMQRHQYSTRTFRERYQINEFEDTFFGHTERTDTNDAQKMINNSEEIDVRDVQVLPEREVSHSMFSNQVEHQSYPRKYLLARTQDEFEGELFDQNRHKGFTIVAQESESHRNEGLSKDVQILVSETGARSVFSNLVNQSNSVREFHSSSSVKNVFDSLYFDQSQGEFGTNDGNMLEEAVNSRGTFPVFLLPSARRESTEEVLNSTQFNDKFNIFEFSNANADIASTSDGNRKQCDQETLEKVPNQGLERNKLRNRTYEMKHEDTDEEQADFTCEVSEHSEVHGNSQIAENSEQGGISEFGENSQIAENSEQGGISEFGENSQTAENSEHGGISEFGENSQIGENSEHGGITEFGENSQIGENSEHGGITEFGENSQIGENSEHGGITELDENSETDGNSEIGEKSGFTDNSELREHSEVVGDSEIEENSGIKEISELRDISENGGKLGFGVHFEISENSKHDRSSDDGKNVDMPVGNFTNNDIAEVTKEDISDHNEKNEVISKELYKDSVTSDVSEDADSKENHQLKNPGQFLRGRQVIVEKIDRLQGDLKQLDCDIEELDSIINRQLSNKNQDRVKDKAVASPFGLPPYRARKHRFRDNILSPPPTLRRERSKAPTETFGSGGLVNGLYKALIQCEPSQNPICSTTKDLTNTKTKTAASLSRNQRPTGHKAASSSKMSKQVIYKSRLPKKANYSTDNTTDSEAPEKPPQECISSTNALSRAKLNIAVISIPYTPSMSCDSEPETGDDILAIDKTSTTNATSEVVVLQHSETPKEIFSKEENSEVCQEKHKNVLTFKDNRDSDEAKETASEYGASTSDVESKVDEKEIGSSAARRSLIARFLKENNMDARVSCDKTVYHAFAASRDKSHKTDLQQGVTSDTKSPKWYHHFIPGKRLARVGPTPGCIFFEEPTPKPTPKWVLLPSTLRHLRSVPVMYGRSFGWLFKDI